jgi:hypothetical protein
MSSRNNFIILTIPRSVYPGAINIIKKALGKKLFDITNLYFVQFRFVNLNDLNDLNEDMKRIDYILEKVCNRLTKLCNKNMNHIMNKIKSFTWDDTKFNHNLPAREILNLIKSDVEIIGQYVSAKIQNYEKNYTMYKDHSVSNIPLKDKHIELIIPKETHIQTDNLTTVYVLVPNEHIQLWNQNYEKLLDMVHEDDCDVNTYFSINNTEIEDEDDRNDQIIMINMRRRFEIIRQGRWIVPRSSLEVARDDNHTLFRVVIFYELEDLFKEACNLTKIFKIKEFDSNLNFESIHTKKIKLIDETLSLAVWAKSILEIIYNLWCHLKMLLLYTNMNIRYGLPIKNATNEYICLTLEYDITYKEELLKKLDSEFHHLLPNTIYKDTERFTNNIYSFVYQEMSIR